MPTFEFHCPHHGAFDESYSFSDGVPDSAACHCGRLSSRVLRPPAGIFVEGGTGAGRGNAIPRRFSRWCEKASDLQRDPYTQAKAQLESTWKQASDMGKRPAKISEGTIQATAAAIHESSQKPPKNAVTKKVATANRMRPAERARRNK